MTKIHPVVEGLLAEIEAYRARAGIDRTHFGLEVMNDGNFISRLEHGRNPRFETIDKVKGYISKKTKAVLEMTEKVEWTSPIIERLKELLAHNDSLSYRFIADQMMKDFPGLKFTRNGISGKVWRLKLPPREKIVIKANGDRPRKPYIRPPRRQKPDALHMRYKREFKFLELRTGQCKWPAGTGPYTFCGKPIVGEGAPYCARHTEMAFVKPKKGWA